MLNPVFDFLDALISDYGVYLYGVFVLSLGVIAWVLSGGLWRIGSHDNSAAIVPGVIITMHPSHQSPPPINSEKFRSANLSQRLCWQHGLGEGELNYIFRGDVGT